MEVKKGKKLENIKREVKTLINVSHLENIKREVKTLINVSQLEKVE